MAAKKAKFRPIDTAVIGLGRAGWNIHIKQIRNDKRYNIVAAAEPNSERRKQAADELGCEVFADYRKMLRAVPAELVIIASPSSMHATHAIAAFKAGAHVAVEKPLAVSVAEVDRITAAGAAAKKKLLVHQHQRFTRFFTFCEEVIASGKLGKIFQISNSRVDYLRRRDWQCLSRFGGGMLNNSGSHAIDMMLGLARSSVTDVLCDMRHISDAGDVEDHVKLIARTKKGITLDLELSSSSAVTQKAPGWTILGTCGAMTIDDGLATLKYFDPKKVKPLKVDTTPAAAGRKYIRVDDLPWKTLKKKAEGKNIGGFYDWVPDSIRKGKAFRVKPSEVREVVRLIELARKQNPKFAIRNARRS